MSFAALCRPLWLLVCAWLTASLGASALAAQPQAIDLDRAQFTPVSPSAAAAPAPIELTLPDTWAQRGLPLAGEGRYRLNFQLSSVPDVPWALWFTRVSSTRRVFLNGQLIEDENPGGWHHPTRAVVSLPQGLLRPGLNEVVVEVDYRTRAGLSAARLGPAVELQEIAARDKLLNEELPRTLNMAMALLAGFMVMLWWRRPKERGIGLFGSLALLASARNYNYFVEVRLVPRLMGDWMFFVAQVWTLALLVAFVLSLDARRQPGRLERALLVSTAVLTGVGVVVALWSDLNTLRSLVYPVFLAVVLVAVIQAVRTLWRQMTLPNGALLLGLIGIVVAAGHDIAYLRGVLPIHHTYWLPFVTPISFGIYGLMLMGRFVRAMNQVELMNLELEHRVQQRTEALQTANAAKTRFLAAASHDLRQPVAAIGLMVSLMREQIASPALRAMTDRVDGALESMERLLKGLLDLSRLESQTTKVRLQVVPLQGLFDGMAWHEAEAAAAKGIALRFRPTRLAVKSDPVLLEQVLRNLVSNAVRYTERGGVLVAARRRGPHEVWVQVWDTGVGIAASDQSSIFEEFVQLNPQSSPGERGLGLGLSIVKRSAAMLGHGVTLRSQPGRGSCFSVSMRWAAGSPLPAPVTSARVLPLRGLRLLVVEDDPTVRVSLVDRLVSWGAEVQAFDGLPAIRAALGEGRQAEEGSVADLLITDQRLQGATGLQVIDWVRHRAAHPQHALPAMVITGDTAPGDLELLEASGVPVLHKPFRAEALLASIEEVLGLSSGPLYAGEGSAR